MAGQYNFVFSGPEPEHAMKSGVPFIFKNTFEMHA